MFGGDFAYYRGKMTAFSGRRARIACGSAISNGNSQLCRGRCPAPLGERHPYRGWRPDPLQMPRVGEVFFPGVRGLRAVVPCLGTASHILVVI